MISFKSYIQTLFEGGNVVGPHGEKADPISTKDRSKVRDDVGSSLEHLHNSFHEATGKHLFGKNVKAIRTGSAFSGSSAHLIDSTISNEELHKHKPTMGDIDTQVPKEHLPDLHKHLTPGKKFGKYTVVKAQKGGNEIHVLAKHENGQHHQIDFEGVEYHHEEPTKFESFAHSSNWEDTKNGIKGASHKQLLNAAGGETHKFSITHGLSPRTDDKKAPAVHGEKDPKEISKKLFGHEHPIDSFDDVAAGIKKHIDPSKHQAIVDKFAERGHPHAVERLKSILGTKKVDESTKPETHWMYGKAPKKGTMKYEIWKSKVDQEKKAKDFHVPDDMYGTAKIVHRQNESLELPDLSHDEHKKLAAKHRDDYLDNHYNQGTGNTSAGLKAKTLWHWHAMRGNKEINHGYFRDSDAFDKTRRKYLLSIHSKNESFDEGTYDNDYTTTKKPKSTHSINCPWRYGHDCECGEKSKTHATDCGWRHGHDCDCGFLKESAKVKSTQETHHAAVTLPMGTSPCSHIGHQDLIDEMLHHAPIEHSHVSLSDKAEYLSHSKRKEVMQKQSPKGINVHVIHGAGESIRAAYDRLPHGKKVLHLVGGEERHGMLDRLKHSLEDGKVKEMEGHKFDEVHVHVPQSKRRTTSNGDMTSGTNFRKALAAGDEKTIKDHLGKAYDPTLSKHLQKGVKSGAIEINRK